MHRPVTQTKVTKYLLSLETSSSCVHYDTAGAVEQFLTEELCVYKSDTAPINI